MSRIFQIIRVSTGIALIAFGACGLKRTYSHITRLEWLPEQPPICLPLDLSTRGVYSGCYRRSYPVVMDDQLRLVIHGSPSAEETEKALSGLSALIVLRDDSGQVLSRQVVNASVSFPI